MTEFVRKVVMTENNDGTITIEGHLIEGEEPIMALVPLSFEGLLESLGEEQQEAVAASVRENLIILGDPDEEFN